MSMGKSEFAGAADRLTALVQVGKDSAEQATHARTKCKLSLGVMALGGIGIVALHALAMPAMLLTLAGIAGVKYYGHQESVYLTRQDEAKAEQDIERAAALSHHTVPDALREKVAEIRAQADRADHNAVIGGLALLGGAAAGIGCLALSGIPLLIVGTLSGAAILGGAAEGIEERARWGTLRKTLESARQERHGFFHAAPVPA